MNCFIDFGKRCVLLCDVLCFCENSNGQKQTGPDVHRYIVIHSWINHVCTSRGSGDATAATTKTLSQKKTHTADCKEATQNNTQSTTKTNHEIHPNDHNSVGRDRRRLG
jgi:hypothetical protein